jgi:hypothetical protein
MTDSPTVRSLCLIDLKAIGPPDILAGGPIPITHSLLKKPNKYLGIRCEIQDCMYSVSALFAVQGKRDIQFQISIRKIIIRGGYNDLDE